MCMSVRVRIYINVYISRNKMPPKKSETDNQMPQLSESHVPFYPFLRFFFFFFLTQDHESLTFTRHPSWRAQNRHTSRPSATQNPGETSAHYPRALDDGRRVALLLWVSGRSGLRYVTLATVYHDYRSAMILQRCAITRGLLFSIERLCLWFFCQMAGVFHEGCVARKWFWANEGEGS